MGSLNRSMARKLAREKQKETANQLREVSASSTKNAIDFAVDSCMAATAMVLWDKHADSAEMLHEMMADIAKLFEEIIEGRVSVDDCRQTLKNEAHLDLIRRK